MRLRLLRVLVSLALLMVIAILIALTRGMASEAHAGRPALTVPTEDVTTLTSSQAASPLPSAAPLATLRPAAYPWGPRASAPSDHLDGRFRAPPSGFTRMSTAPRSFGAFLRGLPLAPEGALVVDFRGNALYDEGRHPNIVAIADLDVGSKDLQHCADAIIRLHAEWRYGLGERDISYRSVSGQALSYRGYVAGDRAVVHGNRLDIVRAAAPRPDDHALFRGWLDDVFAWAGTPSLERDATRVRAAEMMPGDFFVMTGAPFGHAVLILDVARDAKGRAALLLGQSYMPAQSFQVLRDHDGAAWFVVEADAAFVATPFWRPFPMSALRRLP